MKTEKLFAEFTEMKLTWLTTSVNNVFDFIVSQRRGSLDRLAHLTITPVLLHMPIDALPTLAFIVKKLGIEIGADKIRAGVPILDSNAGAWNNSVQNRPEILLGEKAKGISDVDDGTTFFRLHVSPFLGVWIENLESTFPTEQNRQASDVGVGTQTSIGPFC